MSARCAASQSCADSALRSSSRTSAARRNSGVIRRALAEGGPPGFGEEGGGRGAYGFHENFPALVLSVISFHPPARWCMALGFMKRPEKQEPQYLHDRVVRVNGHAGTASVVPL